jgi:hypothetical protein
MKNNGKHEEHDRGDNSIQERMIIVALPLTNDINKPLGGTELQKSLTKLNAAPPKQTSNGSKSQNCLSKIIISIYQTILVQFDSPVIISMN